MKQGKVFFHPIEGSGQLSISWSTQPKGDAVEAKKGEGVGFFSDKGELLAVLFDEVQAAEDHQVLEFAKYKVEISVTEGAVVYKMTLLARARPRLIKKARKIARQITVKRASRKTKR
jgi:hypothetical protein